MCFCVSDEGNGYITLRDPVEDGPSHDSGVRTRVQGNSKLPCGVSAIRDHIQEVDNVGDLI